MRLKSILRNSRQHLAIDIFSSFIETLSRFAVQNAYGNILRSDFVEVGSDTCCIKAQVQVFISIMCFNKVSKAS